MTDKGSNNPVNVPLIGHTVLVKDPPFTILRSKNTVPLKPPDPCSTRKLQHSDNISVADNQALIITSAKTVGCKATPEKTDCIATSVSVSAIFAGDPNLSKQAASSKIATYDATIITPIMMRILDLTKAGYLNLPTLKILLKLARKVKNF